MSRGDPPARAEASGGAQVPGSGLTRRELLAAGASLAVAAGTAVGGVALIGRDRGARVERLAVMRDHRVVRPAGAVGLAIARGPDPAANVRRAIEALGGIEAFVRRGERVVVKPNAGWNRLPEQAANSNPDVVGEVVRLARGAGAAEVWVVDVPVNDAERCFERSGLRRATAAAGGRVVLPGAGEGRFRPTAFGGLRVRSVEVPGVLLDADRIINVAIAKVHGLSGATMCMKNWYGAIGGHRTLLHQEIHRSIVDLARFVKPTLSVLDATRVLVANGPSGGNLADVKRLDTIAASTDEVALDALGGSLLGLDVGRLEFLAYGEQAGLGRADWRSLKLAEVGG